jgi:hypothetical protein
VVVTVGMVGILSGLVCRVRFVWDRTLGNQRNGKSSIGSGLCPCCGLLGLFPCLVWEWE